MLHSSSVKRASLKYSGAAAPAEKMSDDGWASNWGNAELTMNEHHFQPVCCKSKNSLSGQNNQEGVGLLFNLLHDRRANKTAIKSRVLQVDS